MSVVISCWFSKISLPNEGWEKDRDQGPHLHEQDLARTFRDTGERRSGERIGHRDTGVVGGSFVARVLGLLWG